MLLTNFEINLLLKASEEIYKMSKMDVSGNLLTDSDIQLAKEDLLSAHQADSKFDLCLALDSYYYCFSIILSEIRKKKRSVMFSLFEANPKLAQEKSTLKEKLSAEPEYAFIYNKEEMLFQLLNYIKGIKDTIAYAHILACDDSE